MTMIWILVVLSAIGIALSSNVLRFHPFNFVQDTTASTKARFASYYGDHMVLQQAPQSANLWGFIDTQSQADLWTMKGLQVMATLTHRELKTAELYYGGVEVTGSVSNDQAIWTVTMPPHTSGGPYDIQVQVGQQVLSLHDVLFGDVWICSGQSNMVFRVDQMFNSSDEIAMSSEYQDVRIMSVRSMDSNQTQEDVGAIDLHWAKPANDTLVGDTYFSAVCWVYGRILHKRLGYPIGLVSTAYGGTPVEAWSSPRALKVCNISTDQHIYFRDELTGDRVGGPRFPSSLWNIMVYPLTRMAMFGVIWYQGEANSGNDTYNCTFPAMIADWRQTFLERAQSTDPLFPFGFVQLAPTQSEGTGFAVIRRHQTADYGTVPNPKQPNVFMATAVDLPDLKSPYGAVHPRDKRTVGERLARAGLNYAYAVHDYCDGPYPSKVSWVTSGMSHAVQVEFDNKTTEIEVRADQGFEICCTTSRPCDAEARDDRWHAAKLVDHTNTTVMIDGSACSDPTAPFERIRYLFKTLPCKNYKKCPVYSKLHELPALPFTMP